MKKIFIACPFIKFINGTSFIKNDFKEFTEELYDLCKEYASDVFLALKREDYGNKPLPNKFNNTIDIIIPNIFQITN